MSGENSEHIGIQLIKKGKKGLIYSIFGRLGIILVLLMFHAFLLFSAFHWFAGILPHIFGGSVLFTIIMVIYLLNSQMDPSGKITWLVIIMLLPIFGALLLWYVKSDIGHRAIKARTEQLILETKDSIPQDQTVIHDLKNEAPGVATLASYMHRSGCFPVYNNTEVTYFPSGEDKYKELLIQLENAKSFIFLEYFIIDEGVMWGNILEILAKKVKEGVDVRVMYDGTCEFSTLPHDYPKRLQALGIKCKMFARITPFISTHYNYRDHRKILVIDGNIAFNGGVNLADEYINRIERFGHWKDTAVMLRGEAVASFTLMFLQMWNLDEKNPEYKPFISKLLTKDYPAKGYVIPYGDCPLDEDRVGEKVYMDILNRATNYVHIMSPYLILDGEMETALKFAAERGVDVSLILPGIPDKPLPYSLARSHYQSLLQSGVHIYEYTPGFVHAKVFVADDREAVVGTINLDYRSLYHHFECATYMYGTDCIADIEEDFQQTKEKCREVHKQTIWINRKGLKGFSYILKAIAPLM